MQASRLRYVTTPVQWGARLPWVCGGRNLYHAHMTSALTFAVCVGAD